MSILSFIIALVLVGLALYLINKFVPMDSKVRTVLNWTVLAALVLWILKLFGIFDFLSKIRI